MREEIKELEKMGPLPSYKIAMQPDQLEKLERYTQLIVSIQKPVTDEEARVLVTLFGPDDCFELEETLVHLVESAPGWPSEMIGQPSFAYLFPADVEAAQRLFDVKKSGSPNPFRFRLRKKDTDCAKRTARHFGSMCKELRCTTRRAYTRESLVRSACQNE
jgi:hypothetical protein